MKADPVTKSETANFVKNVLKMTRYFSFSISQIPFDTTEIYLNCHEPIACGGSK